MPLKLITGFSKKTGLPNFGSVGASCSLELELEPMIFVNPDALQDQVQEAFAACRQAVDEELGRYQPGEAPPPPAVNGKDESATTSGRPGNSIVPLASERQVDFAHHLAREIRALGSQRLALVVQQLYGRPVEELTSPEASRLIELLKQVRSGARSVDELFPAAVA